MTVCSPVAQASSLRAQRSNPESFRGGILDCFAALAMTVWRASCPKPLSRRPPTPLPSAAPRALRRRPRTACG
ncbi:hypothetical protein GPL20_15785 [Bradyrhizobium cajani]|uniref:Uncharacterized protein n=1 Tax=Bradyrhizobium cajani TaxID=1928661 RepID=A0A844TIQ0_9BRAD|nr:hypothetical protein [Bradyrhizobium cajani]